MTTTSAADTNCGAPMKVQYDGYYNYNEEHYTVWLAHEMSKQKNGGTATEPIEAMW